MSRPISILLAVVITCVASVINCKAEESNNKPFVDIKSLSLIDSQQTFHPAAKSIP